MSEAHVKCIDCGERFPTREELMEHRKYPCKKERTTGFVCTICREAGIERVFPSLNSLNRHKGHVHKNTTEPRSVKAAPDPPQFKPLPKPAKEENMYICLPCKTVFHGYGVLKHCPDCGQPVQSPPRMRRYDLEEVR